MRHLVRALLCLSLLLAAACTRMGSERDQPDLYQTLGQRAGIENLVKAVFVRVYADQRIVGLFANTERVDLDLGFQMSLPARSDDVPARAGMPDLNSLLEFGPRLKVLLSEPSAPNRVRLELPLRVPLEVGNGFRRQGLVFEPRVVFETSGSNQQWQADANIGAVFGNARLNRYFYEVAPQYANANRPAYQAGSGLMMTRLGASLSHSLGPDWRVFGFAQSIEQAASPITAFVIGPIAQLIFIPFMTTGAGVELIGSWFGTGTGRGIALLFIVAGLIGLSVTLLAMQSKAYRALSQIYQKQAPEAELLEASA